MIGQISDEVKTRVFEIAVAPLRNPEILNNVLPLALGFLIIELYFGKHEGEELGWNTSVGNAVLWISTGISLWMTETLATKIEMYATASILAAGSLIAYLDFFHKWSQKIAFHISSPDIVYPLSYVTVIVVKTDIPSDRVTVKASMIFIIGAILGSIIMRKLESPADNDFSTSFN